MTRGRELSQETKKDEGMLEMMTDQNNAEGEEAADKEEYEEEKSNVFLFILSEITRILGILIVCFFFFCIGYVAKPSTTEAYNQGYTDAVKEIVYLEKNNLTEEEMSLLNITAMIFYNDGVVDGTKLNMLINEVITDESIPEELTNYYIDMYNELWNNEIVDIDKLYDVMDALEKILNPESL